MNCPNCKDTNHKLLYVEKNIGIRKREIVNENIVSDDTEDYHETNYDYVECSRCGRTFPCIVEDDGEGNLKIKEIFEEDTDLNY